jgi:hypothetical protein
LLKAVAVRFPRIPLLKPTACRERRMPRLTVATYNTFQEREGRDPALEDLLREELTMICLQEVNPARALEIKRSSASRAFVSLAKYGLLYLALLLPEGARFLERRTAPLNGYRGALPKGWSLRRSCILYRPGAPLGRTVSNRESCRWAACSGGDGSFGWRTLTCLTSPG